MSGETHLSERVVALEVTQEQFSQALEKVSSRLDAVEKELHRLSQRLLILIFISSLLLLGVGGESLVKVVLAFVTKGG